MSVLVVTGTGTGVGKTVVTAAVAALARDRGSRVAVVKPGQTGVGPDEAGDLDDVRRLSLVDDLHEHARFPDPLAPAAAARVSGRPAIAVAESVAAAVGWLSGRFIASVMSTEVEVRNCTAAIFDVDAEEVMVQWHGSSDALADLLDRLAR